MRRPAVFLDRDDTVCHNGDLPPDAWGTRRPGDLLDPDYIRLMPGVREAIASLRQQGLAIVIITNQGGIARGGGDIRDIDACHDALRDALPHPGRPDHAPQPVARTLIDACYSAPHHPAGMVGRFADEHPWRKPGPGMIESAARELDLDLAQSWMVGDKQRDLDAAVAAGIDPARTILVTTDSIDASPADQHQPTNQPLNQPLNQPGATCPDLESAAEHITQALRPRTPVHAERVTLQSSTPGVLSDARTRATVSASAHAIAERTGIRLLELSIDPDAVHATIATHRLAALAFMNELRRSANAWHTRAHGCPLFPERAP